MILLAGVAVWLTRRGENNAVLASVDYMLLYVILMGFIHGRSAGGAASVLMCVWYCASFILRGGSASDLLYNTDHWLPMSVYVLSGTLFGYAQDRRRLKVDLLREEREEISRERDFIAFEGEARTFRQVGEVWEQSGSRQRVRTELPPTSSHSVSHLIYRDEPSASYRLRRCAMASPGSGAGAPSRISPEDGRGRLVLTGVPVFPGAEEAGERLQLVRNRSTQKNSVNCFIARHRRMTTSRFKWFSCIIINRNRGLIVTQK